MISSVISYPKRGPWGIPSYRGNCSGHVIKDLLDYYQPKKFLEIFAGGGTGKDVSIDLNIKESLHLDLNPNFGNWNALRDEVPKGFDFVFSHPPYHNIITYSGEQWGDKHADDLSRCSSFEDFINKLDKVNEKIHNALPIGGRHATLIGDIRKNRKYFSILKSMTFYGELESHLIKLQHNCSSNLIKYNNNFIPITHEHLLIFKKAA